jgi:hypothetical protein
LAAREVIGSGDLPVSIGVSGGHLSSLTLEGPLGKFANQFIEELLHLCRGFCVSCGAFIPHRFHEWYIYIYMLTLGVF